MGNQELFPINQALTHLPNKEFDLALAKVQSHEPVFQIHEKLRHYLALHFLQAL